MSKVKGTFGTGAEVPLKPATAAAATDADTLFEYAKDCVLTKVSDTKMRIQWENGNALAATRGATVDYIPRHMFMHLEAKTNKYDIGADYTAMAAGGVNRKLAWIICMMRRVALSVENPVTLGAETIYTNKAEDEITVDPDVIGMLTANAVAVNAVIQQTFSVLGLNGISLIAKGHHYDDGDNAYIRLADATGLDSNMTALRMPAWQGAIFHDALHPFNYDWVASLVTAEDSGIKQKVHGVVLIRLGVLPAGCTQLGLIKPLRNEVAARNIELAALLKSVDAIADHYMAIIRARPLDYCVHFQRAGTADRLAELSKLEPPVAFMHGYLKALGVKKVTALAAKSLNGISTRQSTAYVLGESAAKPFPIVEKTKENIVDSLKAIVDIKMDEKKASANNNASPGFGPERSRDKEEE